MKKTYKYLTMSSIAICVILAIVLPIVLISVKNAKEKEDEKDATIRTSFNLFLTSVQGTNGYKISKYIGEDENVVLPSTYKKLPILAVGYKAFFENEKVKNVAINSSVRTIESYAFEKCTNLQSVEFQDASLLNKIGERAFFGCTSIENFVFPNGMIEIGERAFSGCSNLKELTFANTITTIQSSAFASCTLIEKVTITSTGSLESDAQKVVDVATLLVGGGIFNVTITNIPLFVSEEIYDIVQTDLATLGFSTVSIIA